jgi:hypothetical protein
MLNGFKQIVMKKAVPVVNQVFMTGRQRRAAHGLAFEGV